jgi:CheY-like chemotaxis protein
MQRATTRRHHNGHRVLVVEDDTDLLEAMVGLLQTAGYVAVGAANGHEALASLERAGPPCLILLDLMMPVMDGWQFRRRQLRDPTLATVPVIVCSAHDRVEDNKAALGVEHYVRKPLDLEALLDLIAACCARE